MKIKTIVEDQKRYNIINGLKIECGGSQDCSHCNWHRVGAIEEWIELHNPICILCDVKPPCYLCVQDRCREWHKDDAFNKEFGTYYGCRKSIERTYCEDFECKYGFLGWWMPEWRKAFEERNKVIERELLAKLRKGLPKQ